MNEDRLRIDNISIPMQRFTQMKKYRLIADLMDIGYKPEEEDAPVMKLLWEKISTTFLKQYAIDLELKDARVEFKAGDITTSGEIILRGMVDATHGMNIRGSIGPGKPRLEYWAVSSLEDESPTLRVVVDPREMEEKDWRDLVAYLSYGDKKYRDGLGQAKAAHQRVPEGNDRGR